MKKLGEQQKFVEKLLIMMGISLLSLTLMGLKSPLGFESDPGPPTDGQIEGAVQRRLGMDSRISADKVGVTIQNNHATLNGTVGTIREKKVAALIAGSVRGVTAVTNNLIVGPSLSQDEQLKNQVEHVLRPLGVKEDNRLMVKIKNGVATLSGTVVDHQDARKAESVVEEIPGVTNVDNMIRIVSKNRPDIALEKDVISYLVSSPMVQVDNIDVQVQDGIVSLEGTVEHLVYRDVLRIDIESITGVKSVEVGKVIPEGMTAASTSSASTSDNMSETQ